MFYIIVYIHLETYVVLNFIVQLTHNTKLINTTCDRLDQNRIE